MGRTVAAQILQEVADTGDGGLDPGIHPYAVGIDLSRVLDALGPRK